MPSSELETMIAAAKAGGKELLKYFGNHGEVRVKSAAADFQTAADVASEAVIVKILEKQFPRYTIHAEERGTIDRASPYVFVVDPLDGTNNFTLGIPFYSVSIALLKDATLVAAVVYEPMTGHTYAAAAGQGATRDGVTMRVNQQAELRQATLAYVAPYGNTPEIECDFVRPIFAAGMKRLLTLWSPALDFCLLASGKIEAIVHKGCEFYDYAAGKLIAREAGAKITTFDGRPEPNDRNEVFLASNGTAIHEQLIRIIHKIPSP